MARDGIIAGFLAKDSCRLAIVLFCVMTFIGLLAQPVSAQVTVRRGIAIYAPFLDRTSDHVQGSGSALGDPDRLIEKGVISDIRSAGFDTIRLPVPPSSLAEQLDDELERSIDKVVRGVELILSAGLTVIIDLHVGTGSQRWQNLSLTRALDSPEMTRYLEVVERLAMRLARLDQDRVIYEPFNEPPCQTQGGPGWPLFMRAIYDRIRRAAPRVTIVITGACWSSWDELAQLDPSHYDQNTLFTFHFYDPHIFTHQGTASTGEAAHYVSRLPYPPARTEEAVHRDRLREAIRGAALPDDERNLLQAQGQRYLDRYFGEQGTAAGMHKRMAKVADWADRHQIQRSRILVGEFGVTKDMAGIVAAAAADRVRWFNDARTAFEHFGFGWIVWNYHYQGGIIIGDVWGPLDPAILAALGLNVSNGQP